jgi:hypothetical protein
VTELSTLQLLELYRERWRHARRGWRLHDPEAEDFGTGGLARRVANLSVRVLALPPDPEGDLVPVDQQTITWWTAFRPEVFSAPGAEWSEWQPTSSAIVRFRQDYGQSRPWSSCLALHSSGAVEMILGDRGAFNGTPANSAGGPDVRIFRLIPIIGRLWGFLHVCREVADRFHIQGPWELSVALCRTNGAYLGGLGDGWEEPLRWRHSDEIPQLDPNVALRSELPSWPVAPETQAATFELGDRICRAWGFRQRLFFAQQGQYAGQSDLSRYRAI